MDKHLSVKDKIWSYKQTIAKLRNKTLELEIALSKKTLECKTLRFIVESEMHDNGGHFHSGETDTCFKQAFWDWQTVRHVDVFKQWHKEVKV